MTNFLHWRKMTWVVLLWGGCVATWAVISGSGPLVTILWLAGMIVLGALWLATQPLFQQGRGLKGFFIRPGWTDWRVVDLHRTHRTAEPGRRHAGLRRSDPAASKRSAR